MKRFLRCVCLFLTCADAAFGQFTVDVYESPSSDGAYVYVTAVLQDNPSYGCSMCTSAVHTYQQSITLRSPTQRGAYNQCSIQVSAANSQNLRCEASLIIDGDYGVYTTDDNPIATCSYIGQFLNVHISPRVEIRASRTGLLMAFSRTMGVIISQFLASRGPFLRAPVALDWR